MKKMSNSDGFTLIELILFIVISGLLASTILMALQTAALKTPTAHNQTVATQAASQCMEWFIGQRNVQGYASINLGSTKPNFCIAPTGYTIATNVASTTIAGDSNYETVTVTVSGAGDAVLTWLMGDF